MNVVSWVKEGLAVWWREAHNTRMCAVHALCGNRLRRWAAVVCSRKTDASVANWKVLLMLRPVPNGQPEEPNACHVLV